MSARVWNVGDPEPSDRPAVVDDEGITWRWMEGDDEDSFVWARLKITHVRGPEPGKGAVLGFRTALDWEEVLADNGPLREATPDEEQGITIAYVESIREAT